MVTHLVGHPLDASRNSTWVLLPQSWAKKKVFESLEAAEIERGDSEWAPFHDEDEWELGQFMMKNLGQTKIDELLKLSSVSD